MRALRISMDAAKQSMRNLRTGTRISITCTIAIVLFVFILSNIGNIIWGAFLLAVAYILGAMLLAMLSL